MTGQPHVVFVGQCLECGDEWRERSEPIICPDCHSREVITTNIEEVPAFAGTRTDHPPTTGRS